MYYNHCTLIKNNITEVSWIPEKFAKVGDVLKLKNIDGSWDNGWIIKSVGVKESEEYVASLSRLWTKQRKASDLPKGTFKK